MNSGNFKEKNADGVDSDVESADDSDHESEITQPEEVRQKELFLRHLLSVKSEMTHIVTFSGRSTAEFEFRRN